MNFIPALLWAAVIFTLSTGTSVEVPRLSTLLEPDKAAHAAAYFVLAGLFMWGAHRGRGVSFTAAAVVFLLTSLYGIGMECIQYAFFPNRFFEVPDIIANIIGSFSGVLALFFLIK